MAGAYKAMKTGVVDEEWAKEHHEYWYNDIKSGKIADGTGHHRVGQPVSGPAD